MPSKFRFEIYDKKHLQNLYKRAKEIDDLLNLSAEKGVKIGASSGFSDPEKPFYFKDFPSIKKQIDEEIRKLRKNLKYLIEKGDEQEWQLSCAKNDAMIDMLFRSTGIPKSVLKRYKQPNYSALKAFQTRKWNGMNLSDRVWYLSEQFKGELEMSLDMGLGEGKSAAQISRDVRQSLRHPDKLFRRVRDKHGILRLSKSAKNYRPGRGVYRSAYKNAIRLTGTENNIAYRTSDYLRWQQLDFVIGIEIKLSNNHTCNGKPFYDICDELAGVYPKGFKFTGWHPQCRCFAVPKLADMKEFLEKEQRYIDGEDVSDFKYSGEVKDVPQNFKTWVKNNQERIERAKSKPYFIMDNHRYIKIGKHYIKSINEIKTGLKEIGVELVVKGDKSLAGWIDEGLKILHEKGFELPKNVFVSAKSFEEDSNDLAFYDSLTNSIVFNGRYSRERFIEETKNAYSIGYYSTDNNYHIIFHEIGHWFHGVKNRESYEKFQNMKLSFNFARKEVSTRATVNALEFIAEVFAGLMDGKKYSKTIMYIYKLLGGKEV